MGPALFDRELLPLTLSFDHAVVDGAPAERSAVTLRGSFEIAEVLDQDGGAQGDEKLAELPR